MIPRPLRMRSFLRFLVLVACLHLACAAPANLSAVDPARSRHVVVISIDGLMPAASIHPEQYNLKIPNLRRLMTEGTYAAGVECVIPSVTYPSHATIVTGVAPSLHGIYANPIFTDPTTGERKYFWDARHFRVRTLWDAAHDAGLKTAAVGWPSTVGGAIDYQVPEIWDPKDDKTAKDFRYALRQATPGLAEPIESEFGPSANKPLDEARTDAAVYILRQYRPDLLLLHIYDLDTAEHDFGPFSAAALKAIELADQQVGRLMEAAHQAGIFENTTFVVVSDHGFLPIKKDFNLGRFLVEGGFIKRASDGRIRRWAAAPLVMGGSAYIFLREPGNAKELSKLYRALAPHLSSGAVGAIFSPPEAKEMTGVDGAIWIEAGLGYRFTEGWSRPSVIEASRRGGYHGFLPYHAGMDASFMAAGAGILRGARLPRIAMTAIAPTLARLLGLVLPQADPDSILWNILERSNSPGN